MSREWKAFSVHYNPLLFLNFVVGNFLRFYLFSDLTALEKNVAFSSCSIKTNNSEKTATTKVVFSKQKAVLQKHSV